MSARVYPLVAQGVFATYGYFVVDEDTKHALLIDPGAQSQLFELAAREQGWTVDAILLTHGHFDHMGAAGELRQAWNAPIYAHKLSPMYLENPELNLSAGHGLNITLQGTQPLEDDDVIKVGEGSSVQLRVIHIPGHTQDSVAYVLEGASLVFVGDAVYEGGSGLTIFPTGDARELSQSLESKILPFPRDTQLLSGHGDPITVAELAYRMRI